MNRLPHSLCKLLGVSLTNLGFYAGCAALGALLESLWLWLHGELIYEDDFFALRLGGGACLAGGLMFAAGFYLLRQQVDGPAGRRSLRLTIAGPQRRRSERRTVRSTFTCLFVGAAVVAFHTDGSAWQGVGEVAAGGLLIYLGVSATTLCHELGHLGVATLLGSELQRLQVGTGPLLAGGKVGDFRWEWRAWLGGGRVRSADERERGWRRRHWLMVAGGPAAHLVVCVALAGWSQHFHPGQWDFSSPQDAWGAAVLFLLYVETWRLASNLVPRRGSVGALPCYTDGYQLLNTLRLPASAVQERIIVTALVQMEALWDDHQRDAVWTRLHALAERYPTHPALPAAEGYFLGLQGDYPASAASLLRALQNPVLTKTACLQVSGRYFTALERTGLAHEARQFCAEALTTCVAGSRAQYLDAFATAVLAQELHALLPEADAWSQELLALAPAAITRLGTRGAVLVELGRAEEGEALLREVWATSPSETDAAISAFYLGVVARRRGQGREVRRWRARAKEFAPFVGKWLETRIAKELTPVAPATAAA